MGEQVEMSEQEVREMAERAKFNKTSGVLREELVKLRQEESDENFDEMDFIEQYALTRLSVEETTRRNEADKNLPKIPAIFWNEGDNRSKELDELWSEFKGQESVDLAKEKFMDMYSLYKEHAHGIESPFSRV